MNNCISWLPNLCSKEKAPNKAEKLYKKVLGKGMMGADHKHPKRNIIRCPQFLDTCETNKENVKKGKAYFLALVILKSHYG